MKSRTCLFLIFLSRFVELPAQPAPSVRLWHVQTYTFVTRYHADTGYDAGAGFGLSIGRSCGKNWLSCDAALEYARATQSLRLIEGWRETRLDVYQSFFALRGRWPEYGKYAEFFLSVQGGCSFFRPQALTISNGAFGQMTLRPKGETKFVAAWRSGAAFRIFGAMAVLLFAEQNFSRFALRRLEQAPTSSQWRPYWHYGAGLSWNF
ncbi:MAG: hypothetical protein ONB46_10880 [candidate division KSB1 bacterium]|nr:hypothetical protein [candidate division KSB1 bacterium]MDZ7366407.1 hypothetical protein [candidate division KSB1 bacterium]MDZ7404062.1 hypothetical protein [candidate division KSB1 bacterium]